MCFYNDDCDWIAEDEKQEFVRGGKARCHECDRDIAPHEWRRRIEMNEHQECQICDCEYDSGDYISDNPDDYETDEEYQSALAELAEHKCTYGEHFECDICRECCLLLEAIYDLERIEGCPEYARQPAYGELGHELLEDSDRKYAQHAVVLFPELATHPLLAD